MKILFLTDNFPPECNAPASRTYEHCKEWVEQGAEVTVITCAPNFPKGELYKGYKNRWKQVQIMDGIKVIRVWSYITPNRGLFKRILDYLSFCFTATLASLTVKADVIVATSPQLFTALAGSIASFFKRVPWIFEIRDLWPESIKAVGAMEENFILKLIDRLVLFLYKNADRLVVVTDSFKERMLNCGVPESDIHVVKNGVLLDTYFQREKEYDLINKHQLKGKFIVGYIGTHGLAHNLHFILDCASKIVDPTIHFLFVGDGAMKSRLINKANQLGLKNVTMLESIPKEEVPRYLSILDVALIPLRKKETFKKVIPSKIFESAAMQIPILLGVEGEAKNLVETYKAGVSYDPENQEDFQNKLNQLYQNDSLYRNCQKGGKHLAKDFDRIKLARRMLGVVKELVSKPSKVMKEVISDEY